MFKRFIKLDIIMNTEGYGLVGCIVK